MEATREIFWNVGSWVRWPAYGLGLIVVLIFAYGLYKRIRLWRTGKPEYRLDNIPGRIGSLLSYGLFHRRILKEPYHGINHFMVFWGFIFLFLGTFLIFVQEDFTRLLFDVVFLRGSFYIVYSFVLDLFGLGAVIGVVLIAFRRYVFKPDRLDNRPEDLFALLLILLVLLTGFLSEGLRIAVTRPEFEKYSFVGWWIGELFYAPGVSEASLRSFHAVVWWVHMLLAFSFIGLIVSTKFLHLITSALNQFFRSFAPLGEIRPIEDIEEQEIFGVEKCRDFTWKQLLDLDACTRCGRCQDNCPAYLSEKPLSPKKVILDLKTELLAAGSNPGSEGNAEDQAEPLAGTAVTEDELWACTTCGACHQACPVFIEVIDKVVDLRRYLVLMESRFPQEVMLFFKNVETNFNPWAMGSDTRADWAKDQDVPTVAGKRNVDYLFWVGCAGSFDDRNKKVTRSLARILQKAGVSFGILGTEETCCGETARRLGNEYLAQILMQKNIELFESYGIKKIIATCPHCYNTFKNEYYQFGGHYEVHHHVELLLELLREGRLQLTTDLDMTAVYHDSCYLGRHNGIYSAPRELLADAGNTRLVEMDRTGELSYCCGAGGGRMWMEETLGRRINHIRIEEAASTEASVVATACPYCLTMLWDGVKDKGLEDSLQVFDVTELIEMAL